MVKGTVVLRLRSNCDNIQLRFHCIKKKMAFRTTAVTFSNMKRWAYKMSGFNKYGLLRDDCLHETEDVTEALRRIPQHVVDERNFRIVRAMQLSLTKTILPEKEWTKYEEDKLYLSPVVDQVRKEREEREEWEKNY